METEKGNKLIAEFMECHATPKYNPTEWEITFVEHNPNANDEDKLFLLSEMKFHTSWDWLMPVVDKCTQIGYRDSDDESMVYWIWEEIFGDNESMFLGNHIDEVWKAVVQFLERYNKNK